MSNLIKELVTHSGRRFIARNGMFYSGDGMLAFTPQQFKQWVAVYGGGRVYRPNEVSERFFETARYADKLVTMMKMRPHVVAKKS